MNNKQIERLKVAYLALFILSGILVIPTHVFSQPYFMPLRFPHYLEMRTFFGLKWPETFEIYHYILYTLGITISLNALGIVFYSRFKNAAIFSSIIGIFLFSAMILFLFFKFINVNHLTAITYGLYSVVLLILDWLTLKALVMKRRAA